MAEDWSCPLCLSRLFACVQELAQHVQLWHDEWLAERRVPPRPVQAQALAQVQAASAELW